MSSHHPSCPSLQNPTLVLLGSLVAGVLTASHFWRLSFCRRAYNIDLVRASLVATPPRVPVVSLSGSNTQSRRTSFAIGERTDVRGHPMCLRFVVKYEAASIPMPVPENRHADANRPCTDGSKEVTTSSHSLLACLKYPRTPHLRGMLKLFRDTGTVTATTPATRKSCVQAMHC
ncbi:hypothetical protein K466DRAFT_18236 [Polyporus arcularius HHB13444]|uniref:Uncharacterized protein n=1 Tax=Polyporus arcularius HHB13444 TaxID=1314778 RepID=A0A5C3PKK9_9APHY|nr:hypothetical protein K466DRAFT_18236 [Polyporus arcularius HHB13444]